MSKTKKEPVSDLKTRLTRMRWELQIVVNHISNGHFDVSNEIQTELSTLTSAAEKALRDAVDQIDNDALASASKPIDVASSEETLS